MSKMRLKLAREAESRNLTHQEYLAMIHEAFDESGFPAKRNRGGWALLTTGPVLHTGHTSACEYIDIEMEESVTAFAARETIAPRLPVGVILLWTRRLPSRHPHLMSTLTAIGYEVSGVFPEDAITRFYAEPAWPLRQTRKGRERIIDLRRTLTVLDWRPDGLIFEIYPREEGTPKPEEVIASLLGLAPDEPIPGGFHRAYLRLASAPPIVPPYAD